MLVKVPRGILTLLFQPVFKAARRDRQLPQTALKPHGPYERAGKPRAQVGLSLLGRIGAPVAIGEVDAENRKRPIEYDEKITPGSDAKLSLPDQKKQGVVERISARCDASVFLAGKIALSGNISSHR